MRDIDAIRARQIARAELAEIGKQTYSVGRGGQIGRVNGLSVLTVDGTPLTGKLLPIEANILPGSGEAKLRANGEQITDSFADSLLTAIDAAKSITSGLTRSIDWPRTDTVLQFPTAYATLGGDSAGAAMATAVISAALKLPIDSSIAMTGAISVQGNIYPVGGVDFKVEAAFESGISCVIVPANLVSIVALNSLYFRNPARFFTHRVILAHTMNEVLRHALIGYDRRRNDAVILMRKGFDALTDGKTEEALFSFGQAKQLTPEDATIDLWTSFVRNAYGKKVR